MFYKYIHNLTYYISNMRKLLLTKQDCLTYLQQSKLQFKIYDHQPASTIDQMQTKVKLANAPYIKNLFYADKKPNTYFLVIAKADTKVEKTFWKKLGTSGGNIRLAKQQQITEILRSKIGSINPFALHNDEQQYVKYLVIDQKLFQNDYWAFHPIQNDSTIQIKRDDFLKYLENEKINFQKIALDSIQEQIKQFIKQDKKKNKPKKQTQQDKQVNLLGIEAKKSQNFSQWYQEVIIKSGLIEYYDVSGCYILRPWAYSIWEKIQVFFDQLIKSNGVQNAYFPLFVSQKALTTQKDHIQGFAPEVAWVTKYGTTDLNEPIAIRPTSQTIMYPAYSKWIQSHRDLPLKLNQWTNVVRWEFKHPTPFIRTRQFLWQQGHTAHATKQQSDKQTFEYLEFYRKVYEQLLAVPVRKGVKTDSQKFAGGDYTTTVQTWIIENGRSIQAATSHNLGQNFAKMFNIEFESDKNQKKLVYQTSWGLTTRSIGIMTMVHGDDQGLVLPPRVANVQVVIIPIPIKNQEEAVFKKSQEIFQILKKGGIRVYFDDKKNYNPGWKYNHWELKGVPIRLEVGPQDILKQQVKCVLRVNNDKFQLKWEGLVESIYKLLDQIQALMFKNAKQKFEAKQKQASDWKVFMTQLNNRNVVLTPWCQSKLCEQKVKERSGIQTKQIASESDINLTGQAKTLCVPLNYQALKQGQKCFHCNEIAKTKVLWGRSY